MQVQVNPDEDTEWNDILRSKGIIPEKEPTDEEIADQVRDARLEYQKEESKLNPLYKELNNKNIQNEDDELDKLLGGENDEEDDFTARYRQERIRELKNQQRESSKQFNNFGFGSVFTNIDKRDYTRQVTEASQKQGVAGVVVLLVVDNSAIGSCMGKNPSSIIGPNIESKIAHEIINKLSNKFLDIKFIELPASLAIENYPAKNCPTILLYKNGELIHQFITLSNIGGSNNSNISSFINGILVKYGIVDKSDSRVRKLTASSDDDDDDDDDDATPSFRKHSLSSKLDNASDDDWD